MYIVRNKNTEEIIHINRAPLSQNLEDQEIYFNFDPNTMEILKTDEHELPTYYKVDENGYIVELTLEEKVEQGIVQLTPYEKVENGKIVQKTLEEQIADGTIVLEDNQIFDNGEIREKTLEEQIEDGTIVLLPDEKLVNGKIVKKTIAEQVADGTIQLKPTEKLEDGKIVNKTDKELYEDGLITLDEYKEIKIQYYSNLAFTIREKFLPSYKITNANLDIYDDTTVRIYRLTIEAFRNEFYRIKSLITSAETIDEIDNINEQFPRKLITE